ncbi:MAG: C40 family peptidase [Pseudomonadota bacterium]
MSSRRLHLPLLLLASTLLAAPCQAMLLDEELDARRLPEPTLETPSDRAADTDREAITDYLRANLGEPYRFGATGGREGFDCSGLVLRAYAAAGLEVPRVSMDQLRIGTKVSLSKLRAGDLLFYRMRRNQQLLHVAVYVGDGRAIHASVGHKKVREIDITSKVWSKHLVAARTLL